MAVKADLSADRERGPGCGQIRITGLGDPEGPIDFSLMRNQGTQPYLGQGRVWQASETWHVAEEVAADSDAIIIPVGPEIIDPIVGQSANVAYRLTVASGTKKQVATLTVHRPLLGSSAAAPDTTAVLEQQQREEAARRAAEEEEAARRAAEEEAAQRAALAVEEEAQRRREETEVVPEPGPEDPGRTRRWPLIAALLVLLAVIGGSAGAWFGCLIEGFGPPTCNAQKSEPEPPREAELSCAGLTDGGACLDVARIALEQKKLEPARQLLQQAASLGSIEANLEIARMYDPETWSAETSPVAAANWETAVFWYEKAARQGDGTGQLAAGKLLCLNALTDFEKAQGRHYLDQAAKSGNGEAQTLLSECR